jgi:hypothetical protein
MVCILIESCSGKTENVLARWLTRKMWPRIDRRRVSAVAISLVAKFHISVTLRSVALVLDACSKLSSAALMLLRFIRRSGIKNLSEVLMRARRSVSIFRQDATSSAVLHESWNVGYEMMSL